MEEKNYLEKFSKKYVELVKNKKLNEVFGRGEEIKNVIEILSRKTKNNPVLVGEAGVGKTAIVEGLAWRIFKNDVPESLKGAEIYEINMASLTSGSKLRGEFEEKLLNIVNEAKSRDNVILFIDEIHTIMGAGKSDAMDAANILKPALARGELKVIGATTFNEYRQYIEKDAALERRFQKVVAEEPNEEQAIAILRGRKTEFEQHHGLRIKDEALEAAVKLSIRYITDKFLPDKAIDVLDEACSKVKVSIETMPEELYEVNEKLKQKNIELASFEKEKNDKKVLAKINEIEKEICKLQDEQAKIQAKWDREKASVASISELKELQARYKNELNDAVNVGDFKTASEIQKKLLPEVDKKIQSKEAMKQKFNVVDEEKIIEVVSSKTGIDIGKLNADEISKVLNLKEALSKRVVGQDNALEAVKNAIVRSKAQINDGSKPIGSFLFLGPTGVGKTEVAKALAEQLFDSEEKIIRIDMSEYMEKNSVNRLTGSAPGYVGYEEGGQLTEAVRRNPYSIVLFDEVEKAHPDVYNVLLQILDDGRLTDSKGVTVNFKNTIIIMTSNLGSEYAFIKNPSEKEEGYKKAIKKFFRPEFINRIDEIVIFNPLGKETYKGVAIKFLKALQDRIKAQDKVLTYDEDVLNKVINEGSDAEFGARPMAHYIKKNIENTLASFILVNQNVKKIYITVKNNDFVIEKGK